MAYDGNGTGVAPGDAAGGRRLLEKEKRPQLGERGAAGSARCRRGRLVVATASVVAMLCGCGAGNLANTVAPQPRPEGAVSHGGERPLLVDWGPSDRTLFNTSRARGPLVIGFVGGRLEPLYNCHANGRYNYTAEHSAQVQDDIIDNADELHAKMPTFGVNFEGALQRTGKLHVRMKVVGLYATDKTTFTPADLQGEECARATHVATYVTVGAFRLFTLSRGELKGDVAIPLGGGVGGDAHADEQTLNEAGDEHACDKAAPTDNQPPDGCSTSLQFVVVPILGQRPSAPPPGTSGAAESPEEPRPSTGSASVRRTLGWVGLGVGVAGLTVAVTTSILLMNDKSTRDAECNAAKQCSQAGLDAVGSIHSLVPWNTTAWIVGALGAGAGTVLLLTSPSNTSARTGLVVAPAAGGARVSLQRSF